MPSSPPASEPFNARYDGGCADCGGRIRVDDLVRYDGDRLVHDECEDPTMASQDVCPDCFTARAVNGSCACL